MNKRQFFAFLLAAPAVLVVSGTPGWSWEWTQPLKALEIESKVYALSKQGEQACNSSSYSEAVSLLREAASYDPTSYSPIIHKELSVCYRHMHKYPQSIEECKKALKFAPDYCEAYYSLAQTNYEYEHFDDAAKAIRKLLQLSPDRAWVQNANEFLTHIETYGNAKSAFKEIKAGHLERARTLLAAAAKHDPCEVSGTVHANLAYVFREMGKPEQAIDEGKKSIQYKSDDKDTMYGLAISYQDIGKFDDATGWLRKYLARENDPEKRRLADELIRNLQADKDKINESDNALPDYLDHMIGEHELNRWAEKSLPVKVHVADGTGVNGFQPQYLSFIPRAMDTWCDASGKKLSYVLVKEDKDADIDVSWISRPIMLDEGGRKRTKQGVARMQMTADSKTGNRNIERVRVEVDTMNSFDPSQPLEESACASVCMHEIGHALGLGHCGNFNDLMYFGASSKQTGLPTRRDRATIAHLYEGYPVSKLAPKAPVAPPAQVRFLPPPAFIPPAPPTDEKLAPPVFLPPPILPENEKLAPPFFKPAPIQETSRNNNQTDKKAPPPPLFTPPPAKQPAAQGKSGGKQGEKTGEKLPFFIPPPVK